MEAQIEVSVKVYLYEQVENKANVPYRNEVINFCEVYPTWEQAERALKLGEVKDVEDGVQYMDVFGPTYQYHIEYENNKGEHVWEIRHERIVKVDGVLKVDMECTRVREKKF